MRAIGKPVFVQRYRKRAEGVGLDCVNTYVKKVAMNIGNHVRPGECQHLVATLELRTTKVVGIQIAKLKIGSRRSVVNKYPLPRQSQIVRRHA